MTIQTLKHQYYILQRLDETEVFIHFLGREEKDARGKRLYDIFQIRDRELAVYSTEPRALIFSTALLAPKSTRTTQGVQVMTLKPKYHLAAARPLEDTPITNLGRYRCRSLPAAGALVREEDGEEQQMKLL